MVLHGASVRLGAFEYVPPITARLVFETVSGKRVLFVLTARLGATPATRVYAG